MGYTRGKLEGVEPKFMLKSVYTNSRSLCNKMDEFEQMLAAEAIDFVSVTETWFNPEYELKIPGYVGFYSSRKLCKGGGVTVYIDKKMLYQTELIYSNSDNGFDVVIVKLFFTSKRMYIAVCYRPPNLSLENTSILCETIRSLTDKNLILLGDFNLGGIDWTSHRLVSPIMLC